MTQSRDLTIFRAYEVCKEFEHLTTELESNQITGAEVTALSENRDKLESFITTLVTIEDEDQIMIDLLAEQIKQAIARKARMEARKKHVRQTLCNVMRLCDIKRITLPNVTISRSKSAPKVVIENEKDFFFDNPHYYHAQEPKLDRKELLEDLKLGLIVDGATLAREETITMRKN
jgi:hypothetical protein